MKNTSVLVIDDDPAMLDLTRYHFEEQGYSVVLAATGEEGMRLAHEQSFDIALTDLQLPDVDGLELVRRLKEASPDMQIIMVTGYSSVNGAIEAIKAGAFYFVEKPVEYEELLALIEKAIEHRRQAEEISQLRGRLRARDSYFNIIGSSKAMQTVYEIIDSVAESDANVMIIGESGTGKELIANAIHYKSLRSKKPFVKINCSALPKELIESELFGHTKGAFTGAASEKNGLIGQATGGSLMLDEIGDMPVELQPKLLRVLQERVYYRLGSEKALEADFRLISATNRDPQSCIADGSMREDLYYRINTIEIHVPPLRERAEDVQRLAEHFMKVYADKYQRPVRAISQQAYEKMFNYSWRGNVRELQNVIERAVLLCKGDTIGASALAFTLTPADAVPKPPTPADPSGAMLAERPHLNGAVTEMHAEEEKVFSEIARMILRKVPEVRNGSERFDVFTELEGAIVTAALERTKGNKQAAAHLLGVHRPRLYHMLRKHHLHQPQSARTEESPADAMTACA